MASKGQGQANRQTRCGRLQTGGGRGCDTHYPEQWTHVCQVYTRPPTFLSLHTTPQMPKAALMEYREPGGEEEAQPGRFVLRSSFGGAAGSFVVHGSESGQVTISNPHIPLEPLQHKLTSQCVYRTALWLIDQLAEKSKVHT